MKRLATDGRRRMMVYGLALEDQDSGIVAMSNLINSMKIERSKNLLTFQRAIVSNDNCLPKLLQ